MNKKPAFYGLFLLAVCAAILFRVVRLDLRPMHHDEANQAVKFGDPTDIKLGQQYQTL